jgi:hypothetical protein
MTQSFLSNSLLSAGTPDQAEKKKTATDSTDSRITQMEEKE